jgi:hypothetical protein
MAEYAGYSKLQKDGTVLEMLAKLEQRLGRGSFQIVDHWDSLLDAVGIAHPRNREVLVYIAAHGPEDFHVELELPPLAGSELPYSVAGEFRSVTFDDLVQIVAKHFSSGGPDVQKQTPVPA